ncbi:MAG: phage scaffolding protein [Ruthenibacterium sp.]
MKREDLTALGVSEDSVDKIMSINGRDIETYKVSAAAEKLRADGLDEQLKTAGKKLEGYDPEWKAKTELAEKAAAAKVDKFRFDSALDAALSAEKTRDAISVKAHLDTTKMSFADGKIIGLSEQLEPLKKDKGFLFESGEKPPIVTASASGAVKPQTGNEQANAALRSLFGKE